MSKTSAVKTTTRNKNKGDNDNRIKWSLKHEEAFFYYVDRNSPTRDNAYKSCIRAGIPESSARNITSSKIWNEKIQRLIDKMENADTYIDKVMNMSDTTDILNKDGEVLTSIKDHKLIKIKSDLAIFVKETLDKKLYSKKVDVNHSGGVNLMEGIDVINDIWKD